MPPPFRPPKPPLLPALLLLLALATSLPACGTFGGGLLGGGSPRLRKTVGLAVPERSASIPDSALSRRFVEDFPRAIETACPEIRLGPAGDLPRLSSGWTDTLAIARGGRKTGQSAVIAGTLLDISGIEGKWGIPYFKRPTYAIRIQVQCQVFDTETGTKILDEILQDEVSVDDYEFERFKKNPAEPPPGLDEVMEALLEDLSEAVCGALSREPWKSYVLEGEGGRVVFPAGEESGLKPGDRFAVRNTSKPMEGLAGQVFLLPGPALEEIRVEAVFPGRSEALSTSGATVPPGATLTPRD